MGTSSDGTVEFGWFGDLVRVRSDDGAAIALLRRLWGNSPGPASPGAVREFRVFLRAGGPPSIRGPRGTRALDARFALWQVHDYVLQELAGAMGDRFLLHAASLEKGGRAVAIAGPSGFGKTTLSLHLAFRGATILSDDLTALTRGAAEIEALPRAVHVRGGSRATLTPSQVERLLLGAVHRDEDGWTVAARDLRGDAAGPIPLAAMVLLRSGRGREAGPGSRCFDLWLASGHDPDLVTELGSLPGVSEIGPSPFGEGAWRVRTGAAGPLATWIRERDPAIIAAVESDLDRPDFEASPSLRRIGPFETAVELCRGLLNRRPGSELDREFRGREGFLVAEVAASLRGVALAQMTPGRIEETVALLDRLVETGDVSGEA